MLPVAETLPDPTAFSSIGWILVGLGALALTLNQLFDFFAKFKEKPPSPPLHKEYATIAELKALEEAHTDFRDEVRVSFDEAAQQSRTSREKIYLEQRRQAELLASNTQKTELTHQRVEVLDTKIDRLLERASNRDR